jgi:4-hydroxybenzoate polyprenyltransferase
MTLEMIRFEHSVFALPFALTGAALAVQSSAILWSKLVPKFFWIVMAMVAARSCAMAFNRVVDVDVDARNPRTSNRHLPAGLLSKQFTWVFTILTGAVLVLAAAMLNPLCLKLSPLALLIVCGYSLTKRFTSLSHLVLGAALGIAPAAAWIAITGDIDWRILWLTAAVTLWTAGFDIIYSCQDFEFDSQSAGLFSLPKRLGIADALRVSQLLHVAMVACLVGLHRAFDLGLAAALGIFVVGALLIYEHSLVKPNDLSRVNAAFFTVNGYVSIVFGLCIAADLFWFR